MLFLKNKKERNVKLCFPKAKVTKKNEHTVVHSGTVCSKSSVHSNAIFKKIKKKRTLNYILLILLK